MNDVYVEAFNNQTFNHDESESSISIIKITTHQFLYFNIYQLKEKKHRS